jgi:hypothetical protein
MLPERKAVMATETQNTPAAEQAAEATKRAADADARQTKSAARKEAAQLQRSAKSEARLTEEAADAKARLTRQAADAHAAEKKDDAKEQARQIRHAAEVDARATVEAVAKDNVQAASELTQRVWERNIELAVSLVPAYVDAYERTAKSFSALYRQTGETAGELGERSTVTPRSVGEALVQAGQAASQLPQAVGETLSEVAAAISRVPEALSGSFNGQVPPSLPALFEAQADLIRETAEATASATRQRLTH